MKKISVREFVEFVLKKGSLDSTSSTSTHSALEGSRIHREIQKEMTAQYGKNYASEVVLKRAFHQEDFTLQIEGRADGIVHSETEIFIDEIKTSETVFSEIEESKLALYWGQVKVYGYFYCLEENLSEITLQLTYFQTTSEEITRTQQTFGLAELTSFFQECFSEYEKWLKFRVDWESERNQSIQSLAFPFGEWRSGQRNLSKAVFQVLREEKKLYAEAPTGTGKTISTLFPAIKWFAESESAIERLFYLTAKTITRTVAENTFSLLREKGLEMKSITLTAKEKICFMEEVKCTPEACPFANGYYERRNGAVWELLTENNELKREVVEKIARKHSVCPFELSLDTSLWVDAIICDYNYLFDPRVALERFFSGETTESIFLIDESHNLIDRARSMYSATLSKNAIRKVRKLFVDEKHLSKPLGKIERVFDSFHERMTSDFYSQSLPAESMIHPIYEFIEKGREYLGEKKEFEHQEEFLQVFFDCLRYQRIGEFYDEHFVTTVEKVNDDLLISELCLNPSEILQSILEKGKGSILFSATFTPLFYYKKLLGGRKSDYTLLLPSPFEKERQQVMIDRMISTTYRNRENSMKDLVEHLYLFVHAKKGNYLFFFPSYQYMDKTFLLFKERYPEVKSFIQDVAMTEQAREQFLAKFQENPSETTVAFCVLGGVFSEGIDLKGDRLIGTAIISIGLPQINEKLSLLKEYFDKENKQGFLYAYQIPGMNKVIQASGRVIRTMKDKGVVLLIDERFARRDVQELFPQHWFPHEVVGTPERLREVLEEFWRGE
ncbi:Rad3-related DNA helicase [Pilibacter termitis]|uniref:Rad3-related DNA helicase n=1 Tax=Pilibacter termitis TaxID=263852 RepID=A0A1T4KND1_9ENTE|nr:ATP-dependent DNA helicase [Pilibacter termitis]SJZ43868.1 Rad3-related DNA helicase [Pilibacter termitis]